MLQNPLKKINNKQHNTILIFKKCFFSIKSAY